MRKYFRHMRKLSLLFCLLSLNSVAQNKTNIKDTLVNARIISVAYTYQIPAADLAKRFGNGSTIEGSFLYKFGRNWLIGATGSFLFSANVREDTILDGLKTLSGNFINNSGIYSSIVLNERGYLIQVKFGKIIPAFHVNPNSGIMATIGVGFIQHKIRIQEIGNDLPQFAGDYVKGYDRLTNGICTSQFLGFAHFDPRKLLNFYTGIEMTEGFTQNRRDWNFDSYARDDSKRLDILIGLKLAWFLPLYGRTYQEFYTH
ncbi:MAG: hypothetical protein D4R43_03380 [Sphingobacteriales bacterium]|nr:MAG: hypothetical protein D4R43_03380 [Sphingobacteriales bacterium]